MDTPHILLVVTSADHMGPNPTGSWYEEVAAPYYTFLDARYHVTLASPQGGKAPLDPTSLEEEHRTAATRRFDADSKAQASLATTKKLAALNLDDYDAAFFAGGHGTMEDFATDATVKKTVEHFYTAAKPLAAVCHGPACLVQAIKPSGEALMRGLRFTCFTDEEETTVGGADKVPFLLESRLRALGGKPVTEPPFMPNVVTDGALITGQNPASSIATAEAVISQLRQRLASAA